MASITVHDTDPCWLAVLALLATPGAKIVQPCAPTTGQLLPPATTAPSHASPAVDVAGGTPSPVSVGCGPVAATEAGDLVETVAASPVVAAVLAALDGKIEAVESSPAKPRTKRRSAAAPTVAPAGDGHPPTDWTPPANAADIELPW